MVRMPAAERQPTFSIGGGGEANGTDQLGAPFIVAMAAVTGGLGKGSASTGGMLHYVWYARRGGGADVCADPFR